MEYSGDTLGYGIFSVWTHKTRNTEIHIDGFNNDSRIITASYFQAPCQRLCARVREMPGTGFPEEEEHHGH